MRPEWQLEFACTSCGACCRRAYVIKDVVPVRQDGTCKHLLELGHTSRCAIYEARPNECRVGFARQGTELSVEEYLRLSAQACNGMQEQDEMPEHFRVVAADVI